MGLAVSTALLLGGCVNELANVPTPEGEQTQQPTDTPYVEGELIVKFTPEVEAMLEGITRSGGSATRSGIPTVDEVLEAVGGYQLERVFPVDQRTEQKSRQSGLHLWYVVRFNGESTEAVAQKLSALGEVQKVNHNRRIYRAYNSKAMPLVDAQATRAALSGAMNDPLLGKQWNIINNGDMFLKDDCIKSVKDADVQVEEAWKKTTGNSQIIVAVLDEGVYYNHPDLKANMWVNEGEVELSTEDNDGNGYAGDI
ncbi:MAG: peptidase S8, partial [Tidjanibacter sp.]|nr:peptidase S8 [Tidjanibacter sp.]